VRRRKEESPVDINVPIVPMLDMSFQLLSFFILTFKPMPQEGQLSLNLPKLDATDTPPEQVDPLQPDENKKDEYTIFLNASADGGLANISMKAPVVGDVPNIHNLGDLSYQLEKINPPAGGGRERVSITIEADPDLTFSRLIEVMNLCKRAGYDTVNLMPMRKDRS
jgi:biopolymer transport protein ExbD